MSTDIHAERLKRLKKIGLLSEVDGRKKLTKSDKDKIRRNFAKHSDILNSDIKKDYAVRNVKTYTETQKKILKKSGYQVIGDKVYITKTGYESVSLEKSSKDVLKVKRKYDKRKTETEILASRKKTMNLRDALLKEYTEGKFKKGEFIGLKLYDNGHFRRAIFTKFEDIFKYVDSDFIPNITPDDGDELKLKNDIKLVKISVKSMSDIAANEVTNTEKNRKQRIRSKNSKAVKIKSKKKK